MRRILAIFILLGAAALAAACSGASGPAIPTTSGSASASASAGSGDLTAFVHCVRQHGVNVPDPNPDLPWPPSQVEQSDGWVAASEACGHLLPPSLAGIANQPNQLPSAQQLEQLRTFAVCMRAHGIDMGDPTPTGDTPIHGRLENVTRAQLTNDPGYKAAYQACKNKLPGGWFSGVKKKNQ
jgi:hypothetical protein